MLWAAAGLATLLGLMLLAWRWGQRQNKSEEGAGGGLVESAIFALFGLLMAFSFSASQARFEERRQIAIQEVNAVSTAALRLDLLPNPVQPEARTLFQTYVQGRLAYLGGLGSGADPAPLWTQNQADQTKIWKQAVVQSDPARPNGVHNLLLPALNEMFDIANTRHQATLNHIPPGIALLLSLLSVLTAWMAGRALGTRPGWLAHATLYAVVVVATLGIILDLDYPRLGLIRVDYADAGLRDVVAGLRN